MCGKGEPPGSLPVGIKDINTMSLFKNIKNRMKYRKPETTTRTQILIGMIISILIPLIFVNTFYIRWLNEDARNRIDNYNRTIVEQAGTKVDTLLTEIEITKRQLIASAVSSDTLMSYDEMSPAERLKVVNKYTKILRDINMSTAYHAGIFLVGSDNMIYPGLVNLDSEQLLKDMEKVTAGVPYNTEHYKDLAEMRVIPFIAQIRNYEGYDLIREVIIELYYTDLEEKLEDMYLGEKSEVFIINDSDQLIYYSGVNQKKWNNYIGKKITREADGALGAVVDGREYQYRSEVTDWNMVVFAEAVSFSSDIQENVVRIVWMLAGCILFAFFYSYFISKGITKPLNSLMVKMRNVDKRETAAASVYTNNRDIQELSVTFDDMLGQIDKLMESMIQKEKENAMIQLKALQAQINPHFLYNTLEVMRSIALENNLESIEVISRSLAKMFRYSISKAGNIVKVRDEVEHIKNYSVIQQYRYGNRIEFLYSIDSNILDKRMVKFVLQPIVENAIIHGLDSKTEQGVITIIGMWKEKMLEFRIIDNGMGMNKEKLADLKENFRKHNDLSAGIGLANVDARLQLYYGPEYGLEIESEENKGTQVIVRIPLKGGSDD